MREVSDPGSGEFVVEPMTDLAGTPVVVKRRPSFALPAGRLGQVGVIALVEGLALLVSFFFPWFFFPQPGSAGGPNERPGVEYYSGWATAIGIQVDGSAPLALFVHLWLVPLAAVALLGIVWVYRQRLISARLSIVAALALSVLALLVEGGFYIQVASLVGSGNNSQPPSFGVAWGFWAGMVIATLAIVVCGALLRSGQATPESGLLKG